MDGVQFEHQELRAEWEDSYQPPLNQDISKNPPQDITLSEPQKLGVAFLHSCRRRFGYALLGDEMGYGKVRWAINLHC